MAAQKRKLSQVLPAARIMPRLAVAGDLQNRLTELALEAYGRSLEGDRAPEPS
jgi:hypothetical protein